VTASRADNAIYTSAAPAGVRRVPEGLPALGDPLTADLCGHPASGHDVRRCRVDVEDDHRFAAFELPPHVGDLLLDRPLVSEPGEGAAFCPR
jgi:hypothetical protein